MSPVLPSEATTLTILRGSSTAGGAGLRKRTRSEHRKDIHGQGKKGEGSDGRDARNWTSGVGGRLEERVGGAVGLAWRKRRTRDLDAVDWTVRAHVERGMMMLGIQRRRGWLGKERDASGGDERAGGGGQQREARRQRRGEETASGSAGRGADGGGEGADEAVGGRKRHGPQTRERARGHQTSSARPAPVHSHPLLLPLLQ